MNLKAYWDLTKPRLASLVMLSALVGYVLAPGETFSYSLMIVTLFATALVAGGSLALNQWMERSLDAKMKRTLHRPIPEGTVKPAEAFIFGMVLSIVGLLILYFKVNVLATLLAATTTVSYLVLYTPLKTKTSLCTIVGALPGAIPPMIGWAAVTGTISFEAWVIFTIIFLWQMPHFLAIAWLYREDFEKAGFRMLSVESPDGKQVARQIILYTAALLPVSLVPSVIKLTGSLYFYGALGLGIALLIYSFRTLKDLDTMARPFFKISVLYLTVIFILLMVDKL